MDTVLRATIVYAVLLVLLQLTGRRTLGQITTFDFVLLLIISEATQQAMIGQNSSITNAVLAIATLCILDVLLAQLKLRAPGLEKWIEGAPLVVVRDGKPQERLMRMARIDREDVMKAARHARGIERMSQIKYAVLEVDGHISIIERDPPSPIPPD